MKIVEFSLKKRITVAMIVAVLVIMGLVSFQRLGLDMLPDIDQPFISIVTIYSGVSSEDIEQNLTRPIEQIVATVSNVKELKSISQEGVSVIMVEFESGTNLDFAAQDVRDQIGLYENFLPEDADKPLVIKFNMADMPIMMYGITGGKRDLKKLKIYIDNEVATRLERLEGVASAITFSPEESEILVNIDKGKLESRGLSITQVERAIQASNINLPSGYMDESHKEYLIRTIGEFERIDEIEHIVVGFGKTGEPIFLKNIADVNESAKEIRNLVRIQGEKGIMLIITKSSGYNTVLMARAVKKSMEKIKPTLDPDLTFHVGWDMSRIIEITASRSSGNILMGGILAILLIFVFLRNFRPTVAIGIAIPLSVITTFIAMNLAGYTLNLITLGGLALGVGMLVDNAVVVIENIFRQLEEGKSPYEAAKTGTSEVGMAIIASTLTTIAVFFPMMFAEGLAGDFSRPLALTIAFALLSSLFIALTIIPMLASWFFKVRGEKIDDRVNLGKHKFEKFKRIYESWLKWTLRRRILILFSVVILFLLSIVLAFRLGGEFMPQTDRSMVMLKLRMPVGTNLSETNRIIKYLEEQAIKDKNAISTMVQVGISEQNAQDSASGFNPAGSYEASLWAFLVTSSKRDITDQEIVEQWRQYFPELEKGKINFLDMSTMMSGGGSQSAIELSFFGRDLKKLEMIAEMVKKQMKNIEGLRDVEISLEKSKPEMLLRIRKEEASKLGLTPYDISRQVQSFTIGTVVSRMIVEGEELDIRVRLQEKDRNSLESLKMIPIVSSTGSKVYLSQIVNFEQALGPIRIDRENQVRKVSVTANLYKRSLNKVVRDIMDESAEVLNNLPEGYFYEMGGQYKEMQETFSTMFFALILAVILVYAVMASQFESLKSPFIIMFTIPLAFIGVVLLMFITGNDISLPVFMGFIMMMGIVVNNGIVMVDYINQLISRGIHKYDAVVNGAVVRLRPVLITALSTMLGMLPMALASSEGSEMRSPMAIALIGGLMASTFLTLFIVPILYTLFSKIKVPR